jgi:hypothetical protein
MWRSKFLRIKDSRPSPSPALDLFDPARVAGAVRARAGLVGTAVPNGRCLDIEKLSGPARQKRCTARLRLFASDIRSLWGQIQPSLPWACQRWRFFSRRQFLPLPLLDVSAVTEVFRRMLLLRLHKAERLSESFMQNLFSWVHPGFSVYAGPPVDAAEIASMESQAR